MEPASAPQPFPRAKQVAGERLSSTPSQQNRDGEWGSSSWQVKDDLKHHLAGVAVSALEHWDRVDSGS